MKNKDMELDNMELNDMELNNMELNDIEMYLDLFNQAGEYN